MNTRINSVSGLLKIFLLTAFSFIAMIILFPQSAQARLVMKTTSDGFTLNGNVTYDPEDDDSLYHNRKPFHGLHLPAFNYISKP